MAATFFRRLIARLQPLDLPIVLPAHDKGQMPPGIRVYAVGDVHGRADLLRNALDIVDADIASDPPEKPIFVGMGDFIDRGPESRSVLDILSNIRDRSVLLKGNHEQILLSFLNDPVKTGPAWLETGGWEFLRSYGVRSRPHEKDRKELSRIRDDLVAKMPDRHLKLIKKLRLSQSIGGYFFAHAGARAGVPLDQQSEEDLLWIRKGFSDKDEPFEKIVVHGHTPVTVPYVGLNRINIDTGAYATGKLTLVILQGLGVRFVHVGA